MTEQEQINQIGDLTGVKTEDLKAGLLAAIELEATEDPALARQGEDVSPAILPDAMRDTNDERPLPEAIRKRLEGQQ